MMGKIPCLAGTTDVGLLRSEEVYREIYVERGVLTIHKHINLLIRINNKFRKLKMTITIINNCNFIRATYYLSKS